MLEQSTALQQISRLLAGFPSSASDAQTVLEAYLTAIDGADVRDLSEAVDAFLAGRVERNNHEFAPSAATLAYFLSSSLWR